MTYSAPLGSTISNTRMRTPNNLSVFSGMCSVCTANCYGPCEIGLSAVRGSEAIYPYETDQNQFASEKKYPIDYSHLSINGKVETSPLLEEMVMVFKIYDVGYGDIVVQANEDDEQLGVLEHAIEKLGVLLLSSNLDKPLKAFKGWAE